MLEEITQTKRWDSVPENPECKYDILSNHDEFFFFKPKSEAGFGFTDSFG